MADMDDDWTEGPEGYFVEAHAPTRPSERRMTPGGRRTSDVELRRANKRLAWSFATVGAFVMVGALMAVAAWLES